MVRDMLRQQMHQIALCQIVPCQIAHLNEKEVAVLFVKTTEEHQTMHVFQIMTSKRIME